MKTILLLGCNGQLGYESQRTLPTLGTVVALDFPEVDFSQPESLRSLVRQLRPDIIVNAAAYTAVDKAETNEASAVAINAIAPGVLAAEAAALGAIFVHYSTDYVFDGLKTGPYVETDPTHPSSVYGRTKRDGEIAATQAPKHLIFRTSWVVGAHGKNFIRTMLHLAQEHEELRVVADQFGAPTSAKLLAEISRDILKQMQDVPAADPRWGLYHLVGSGETNWNALARYVIDQAATYHGLSIKACPKNVEKIATADYPTSAMRPFNSRLDAHKLQMTFGITLPDWHDGVDDVLTEIVKGGL